MERYERIYQVPIRLLRGIPPESEFFETVRETIVRKLEVMDLSEIHKQTRMRPDAYHDAVMGVFGRLLNSRIRTVINRVRQSLAKDEFGPDGYITLHADLISGDITRRVLAERYGVELVSRDSMDDALLARKLLSHGIRDPDFMASGWLGRSR